MAQIPDDTLWMRISELCLCILGSALLCQLHSVLNYRGGPFLSRVSHLAYDGYTLIWTALLIQYFIDESRNIAAEDIFLVVGCTIHLIVALTAMVSSFVNKCKEVLLLMMGIICMLVFALMLTDLVLGMSRKKEKWHLPKNQGNMSNEFYNSEYGT